MKAIWNFYLSLLIFSFYISLYELYGTGLEYYDHFKNIRPIPNEFNNLQFPQVELDYYRARLNPDNDLTRYLHSELQDQYNNPILPEFSNPSDINIALLSSTSDSSTNLSGPFMGGSLFKFFDNEDYKYLNELAKWFGIDKLKFFQHNRKYPVSSEVISYDFFRKLMKFRRIFIVVGPMLFFTFGLRVYLILIFLLSLIKTIIDSLAYTQSIIIITGITCQGLIEPLLIATLITMDFCSVISVIVYIICFVPITKGLSDALKYTLEVNGGMNENYYIIYIILARNCYYLLLILGIVLANKFENNIGQSIFSHEEDNYNIDEQFYSKYLTSNCNQNCFNQKILQINDECDNNEAVPFIFPSNYHASIVPFKLVGKLQTNKYPLLCYMFIIGVQLGFLLAILEQITNVRSFNNISPIYKINTFDLLMMIALQTLISAIAAFMDPLIILYIFTMLMLVMFNFMKILNYNMDNIWVSYFTGIRWIKSRDNLVFMYSFYYTLIFAVKKFRSISLFLLLVPIFLIEIIFGFFCRMRIFNDQILFFFLITICIIGFLLNIDQHRTNYNEKTQYAVYN